MGLIQNLPNYVGKQLENFFPDGVDPTNNEMNIVVTTALEKLKVCFKEINNKYFAGNFEDSFTPLHGDQYAMFLYLASRAAFEKTGNENLASKLFNLNKALHGIDAFYKIRLPDIFLFVHPLGTVLGNANYKDFFCVYQGCTVGSKTLDSYPNFLGPAIMYANSTLIGKSTVGINCILASGSSLIEGELASNCTLLGAAPNHRTIKTNLKYFNENFHHVRC